MNCKNCEISITETDDFCKSCGAKVIRNRLTIRNLFEHFSEQFLDYDNKFLKTFIHLFTKPEVVIGGYIEGTRKKYVNAISYFAIAITFSGLQLFILNKFFPEAMDYSSFDQKGAEEMNKQIMNITQEYQTLIMMFYIPFYALMSKLVFFNHKQYNYTEHLVIFLYAQAQVSIFGFFFLFFLLAIKIPFIYASLIYTFFMFLYMTFVLKRMHNLDAFNTIIKTLLFALVLFVLVVIPLLAFGIYKGMQQVGLSG